MSRFPGVLFSLNKKADFQRVFKKNIRSADHAFVILARPGKLNRSRLGLAISRKYAARAVDRSRIKRLVRESFYRQQPFIHSLDIVVINRPGLNGLSNQEVSELLEQHWKKIVTAYHAADKKE